MSRISILDKDRCQPKKCDYLCIHYCPGVRMDEDTIVVDEDTKKPLISEESEDGVDESDEEGVSDDEPESSEVPSLPDSAKTIPEAEIINTNTKSKPKILLIFI